MPRISANNPQTRASSPVPVNVNLTCPDRGSVPESSAVIEAVAWPQDGQNEVPGSRRVPQLVQVESIAIGFPPAWPALASYAPDQLGRLTRNSIGLPHDDPLMISGIRNRRDFSRAIRECQLILAPELTRAGLVEPPHPPVLV